MKFCCFLFDDDDYDHSHIMGTIVTNDIVYYHALPIKKNNMLIVMTIGDDYFF